MEGNMLTHLQTLKEAPLSANQLHRYSMLGDYIGSFKAISRLHLTLNFPHMRKVQKLLLLFGSTCE